jgi:hypothetical protein
MVQIRGWNPHEIVHIDIRGTQSEAANEDQYCNSQPGACVLFEAFAGNCNSD